MRRRRPRGDVLARGALAPLLLLAAAIPVAAQTTIDDFSTAQAQLDAPPDDASSVTTAGGDILGQDRDLTVAASAGVGPVTVEVSGGALVFAVADTTPDSAGTATVVWDADSDPGTLDPDGLGGADLTSGGASAFHFVAAATTAPVGAVLEVFTDGANVSTAALVLPVAGAAQDLFVPFSAFVPTLGAGADFTSVGAIRFALSAGEASAVIELLETVVPSLAATKVDALTDDLDADGRADPGDTLTYTITLTNTGGEALAVDLSDMVDASTTLGSGTVRTTPIARGDQYTAFGNVTLIVDGTPPRSGLLANDGDPDGDALTVTAFDAASLRGGTVAMVDPGTGAFEYTPPAGFRGVDTFTYTIEDDDGNAAVGTATILITGIVWFVDNTSACPGSGTQADPFCDLSRLNGTSGNVDGPGDAIFVYEGTSTTPGQEYAGGLPLEDGQRLLGQPAGLTIDGQVIVPAGGLPPVLIHTGAVVTLASDVEIASLEITTGGGPGIAGVGAAGTTTVTDVEIYQSPSSDGVSLVSQTGTFTFTGGELATTVAPVGVAVRIDGGDADVSFTGTSITRDQGGLVEVVGTTGGTRSFTGGTTLSLTSGTLDGVRVQNAMGTTQLDALGPITTGNGRGIFAANGGTLSLGTVGAVSATGGAALDVSGTTVVKAGAPGPIPFASLSSTGSPATGVSLDGVTTSIEVTGTTMVTDADTVGIRVANGAATSFDFGATTVIDTNVGAGATADGIDLATGNAGATFTFDSLAVTTDGGLGLRANGSGSLTVTGADNDFNVTGGAALSVTSTVVSVTLDLVSVTNAAGEGVRLVDTMGVTSIADLQANTTGGVGLFADAGGNLNVTTGSVTSTNRAAVDVNNTSVAIALVSLTSNSSVDHGVDLTNLPAGSTFSVSGVTSVNGSANEGVMIAGIGANAVLAFGSTQVAAAGAEGIEIRTVGAGADLDFGQTDVTNRNATGILVDEMNGASLDFGATTIPNPSNAGGYGLRVEDSSGAVTLAALNVSDAAVTVAEVDANADFIPENEGDGDAVFLIRNSGSFTMNGGSLSGAGGDGIDARQSGSLTLSGVTIQSPANHGLRGLDLRGALGILSGSLFTQVNTAARDAVRVINTTPESLAVVVDDADFTNSVTGSNAIFLSGRSAADMDLTIRNGSAFQDFGGSAVLVNAGDTLASTARIDLVVRDSTFTGTVANVLTTVAGQGLENGTLTAVVEDNTFTNVARVLGSNTGVITFNGNGTSSNEVAIRRNTISSPALVTGYRGIQIFADNDSVYPTTIRIEDNDVFDVDQEGLVLDVATNGGVAVNARITGNDFGSAASPVGTDGNERGVTIFTRRFDPSAPTANVLFQNNRVFINSTSSARQPLEITGENDATLNLTLLDSTIENLGTSDDGRFTTFESGTICLDMRSNAFGSGGPGTVNLRDFDPPTSSFDVVQTNAATLSTANGGVSVTADATVSFGQPACTLPP